MVQRLSPCQGCSCEPSVSSHSGQWNPDLRRAGDPLNRMTDCVAFCVETEELMPALHATRILWRRSPSSASARRREAQALGCYLYLSHELPARSSAAVPRARHLGRRLRDGEAWSPMQGGILSRAVGAIAALHIALPRCLRRFPCQGCPAGFCARRVCLDPPPCRHSCVKPKGLLRRSQLHPALWRHVESQRPYVGHRQRLHSRLGLSQRVPKSPISQGRFGYNSIRGFLETAEVNT
jgi:hypothetical protein